MMLQTKLTLPRRSTPQLPSHSVALRRQHINALSFPHYLGAKRAAMSTAAGPQDAAAQNAAAPTTVSKMELDVGNKVDELLTRYTEKVQPAMNWISKQKKQLEVGLGTRWPEGLFPYDTYFDDLEVTKHKNVAKDYWNAVVNLYKKGVLDDDFFKTANMAGRAREYRLLVEPVEICNYYHGNMHLDSEDKPTRGHYIDGITVELEDDNNIRPGRFRRLQQIEQRVLPQKEVNYIPKSSLGLARELKERVGDLTWEQYQKQQKAQAAEVQQQQQLQAPDAAAADAQRLQSAQETVQEQPDSKTAAGWYCESLSEFGKEVPWDVFWHQLKRAIKETSLDGARWKYVLHHLHQEKQQLHFQQVVSRTGDSSGKLAESDFRHFADLTEHKTLAEVIELAMTSSLSNWQGGTNSPGCTWSDMEQATAGGHIVQWSVKMDLQQRIVALQGCATKAGQSAPEWLRAAPALDEFWGERNAPAQPCSSGFAELYGTKEPSGLTSFMDAPADASTGTQWRIEGSKLSLQEPRAVGYQVRLSADKSVNAARFMFRSFAPVSEDTLYDAVFISHTNMDPDAGSFAGYLHRQLNKAGIACFLDARSLHGGTEWRKSITAWAKRCRVFVAIISPSYPKRPWALAELHLALRERKAGAGGPGPKTIPVLYDVHRDDVESVGKPYATKLAQQWAATWPELKAVKLGGGDELQLTGHAELLRGAFESQGVSRGEVDGRKTKVSDADLADTVEKLVLEHIRTIIT